MLKVQNHQVFGKDKSDRAIAIIKEKGSGRIAFTAQPATEVLFPIYPDYFHGSQQNVFHGCSWSKLSQLPRLSVSVISILFHIYSR